MKGFMTYESSLLKFHDQLIELNKIQVCCYRYAESALPKPQVDKVWPSGHMGPKEFAACKVYENPIDVGTRNPIATQKSFILESSIN